VATIVKTTADTWKAVIRKRGWPTQAHTFRLKSDAVDWARTTEDEIVRGVYVHASRTGGERMTVAEALYRYLSDVTPTKRSSTQKTEDRIAASLRTALGRYSLAAVTPKIVAAYRDQRLASKSKRTGRPMANNTVRLELALLGHLFTIAIKEWGWGCRVIRSP